MFIKVPHVKGLLTKFIQNEETDYYTNEKMLEDGLIIESYVYYYSEDEEEKFPKPTSVIALSHLSANDATNYTIYEGEYIRGIQEYRIIKDIFELYNELPLEVFLNTMHYMSGSFKSASMQSKDEHRMNIQNRMEELFDKVRGD